MYLKFQFMSNLTYMIYMNEISNMMIEKITKKYKII